MEICDCINMMWNKSFLFYKKRSAYYIRLSLVGSEMCIRYRDMSQDVTDSMPVASLKASGMGPKQRKHEAKRQRQEIQEMTDASPSKKQKLIQLSTEKVFLK